MSLSAIIAEALSWVKKHPRKAAKIAVATNPVGAGIRTAQFIAPKSKSARAYGKQLDKAEGIISRAIRRRKR